MTSNWPWVNLSSVCKISTGKKDANQGSLNGQYPFFTCAKDHIWSDTYSFDTKAILIAGNGQVGQSTYFEGKFEAYQRTYVLSDFHSIDERFLFLYIDGFLKRHLEGLKMGNTMPYIKLGMLQNFEVPLPPLDEQKRIVAKLDLALSDLDQVLENSKFALDQINAMWSASLSQIFDSESDKPEPPVFTKWSLAKVGDISEVVTRGISPVYDDHGKVDVINQRCIRGGRVLSEFARRHDSEKKAVPENKFLRKNDILINSTGVGTVGRSAVVSDNVSIGETTVDSHVTIVRSLKNLVDSNFLHLAFLAFEPLLISKAQGSGGQVELSRAEISNLEIPLPPLDKQKQIVAKLDVLNQQIDSLRKAKQGKIEEANSLRSSILSAAFAGDF